MNYKIDPQSWKQDMPAFRKKTIAFYNGEITKKDYKGFSGLYGSYAQKNVKKVMLQELNLLKRKKELNLKVMKQIIILISMQKRLWIH